MAEQASINLVAFQGKPGAYSDLACRNVFPGVPTLPCDTFEDTFAAVESGEADRALLPIENSQAGRVADVHQLLPHAKLHIVGEYFLRVNHKLLAPKGATLQTVKHVHSHVQALQQCRGKLRALGMEAVVNADTAGAAREIAISDEITQGALASGLAAEIYGLAILDEAMEDAGHNTTRFLVLSRTEDRPDVSDGGRCVTSLLLEVRNVPAALYKALGGFATNGVNLTKLESYMVDGRFVAAQFYIDAEGHPEDRRMKLALDELSFYAKKLRVLGVYPAHPFRDGAYRGE